MGQFVVFNNFNFQFQSVLIFVIHQRLNVNVQDNQVPVCPLCNKPVPVKKGEVADLVVGRHIDNDCQSDPARERRKVSENNPFLHIYSF